MILGILAAAALSSVAGKPVVPDPPAVIAEPMPNTFHQPAYCPSVVEREVARQNTAFHGRVPAAQYAVLRQIDGCGVPTPVGYHPRYLLPGAADPASKPAGAPPSKR